MTEASHGLSATARLSCVIRYGMLCPTGAYQFPAMRQLAITTGDAFILVYGVDDEASFEQVELLRDQIVAEKDGDDRTPIVIVGNKTDLGGERRRVDQPTAETTASIDWGTGYVEVYRA